MLRIRTTTCLQWLLVVLGASTMHRRQAEAATKAPVCPPSSLAMTQAQAQHLSAGRPLTANVHTIIAHRGASAYVPEHTLAAYRLALELGADYIEPDLVATSDGHLIAMHTVDLNVTTNVQDMFETDDDRLWYSPTAKREGYWSFNFTLEEIQQLRVKQRLQGRNDAYNGYFTVPTLDDILELLHQYNSQTVLRVLPEGFDNQFAKAGLYAELKDFDWLKAEANLDLVDILLAHMEDDLEKDRRRHLQRRDQDGDNTTTAPHEDDQQQQTSTTEPFEGSLWASLMSSCDDHYKFNEYPLPGLVIQSFDGASLLRWHDEWKKNKVSAYLQAPPLILLVDHPTCWKDEFWFEVGDKYRGIVAGIGSDKSCLVMTRASLEQYEMDLATHQEQADAFWDKVKEFQLQLHVWTERPENEYISLQPVLLEDEDGGTIPKTKFPTELEEMRYFFCEWQVNGLFTESVSTAVMASRMGCDTYRHINETGLVNSTVAAAASSNCSVGAQSSAAIEQQQTSGDNGGGGGEELYFALASFVMGVFVTTLIVLWQGRTGGDVDDPYSFWRGRRMNVARRRRRHYRVPTAEEEDEEATYEQDVSEEGEFQNSNGGGGPRSLPPPRSPVADDDERPEEEAGAARGADGSNGTPEMELT